MRLKQKLRFILLPLIVLIGLFLTAVITNKSEAASICSGVCDFSESDILAVNNKSAFQIHQSGTAVSIIGTISHKGKAYTVTFNGTTPSNTRAMYPYENSTNFCTPDPKAIVGWPQPTTDGVTRLWVQFDSLSPLHGKITNNGSSFTQLWPGLSPGSPEGCGVKMPNGQVRPVNIVQDNLSLDNAGTYNGPGAQYTESAVKAATFSFDNAGVITMHFQDSSISDIKFVDKTPTDTTFNFVSQTSPFCNGSTTSTSGGQINFSSGSGLSSDPQPGQLSVGFIRGPNCVHNENISINVDNVLDNLAVGSGNRANEAFQWLADSSIQTIDCTVSSASCSSGGIDMKLVPGATTTYHQDLTNKCGGFVTELDAQNGNTGKFFKSTGSTNCSNGAVRTAVILGAPGQQPPGSTCSNGAVNPADNPPCTKCPDGSTVSGVSQQCPTGPGGGGSAQDEACFGTGWSLNWLACPLISALQSITTSLYNLIEEQLQFCVPQTGSNCTASTSTPLQDPNGGIHTAWNGFRILVSGLIVILLLVMVIGQAIGSGPFDAYTVKKMLPRLVIGAILIQISWPVFSWVVNIVDDLGHGLADLIFAPFGGQSKMDLLTLLAPFGTAAVTWNWVAIVFVGISVVIWPFLLLSLLLAVVAGIFVGLVTLIFRKILIILALIFVPVALISWMMPNDGLRRYWKLWWDNFIKALLMFPMIILIIAAGRIFALIGGPQGGFIGFFIVLVGFFGPLFILPKTYKWGGTVMQMASNGLQKVQERGLKKPQEFLGKRQEGYSNERKLQSQERYASGYKFNPKDWKSYYRRPIDLFRSGQYDPTMLTAKALGAGRMRQRAMTQYVEQGEKSMQEDINAAEAKLIRERQRHRAAGGQHDVYLQAIASGLERFKDPNTGKWVELGKRSDTERIAARKQLAKLGAGMNWRYLENYYQETLDHGTDKEKAEMRKFFDDNVETILPKLPHIYKSIGQAADASPDAIAQMHGVEIESVLANLSHQITTGTTHSGRELSAAERQSAQTSLTTFLQNYQRATENPQLSGQLENGGLRAMHAFLESNDGLLTKINVDDGFHGRQQGAARTESMPGERNRDIPELVGSADVRGSLDGEHAAVLDRIRTDLRDRISSDGFLTGRS